jgi:hypothetical protein
MRAACRSSSFVGLTVFLFATACADSTGPGPGPGPGPSDDVNAFLLELPGWAAFSPTLPSQPPAPTGAPSDTVEILDVRQVEEDGSVTLIPDVHHACTTTPYAIRENPEKIVMYNPDKDLLWPGALIQGKSHRDGLGSLLGLTIAERTPIRVSVPSLANQDNFREVANPDQATVSQAIGSMIGNATAAGLATPSTITFEQRVYHSENEWALSGRASGHYMGFSASATGDIDRKASETTVTAHFYQRMYDVVVAPPQTPSSFFSSDFTPAKLQEQRQLNRIGPDNIPVYISNIVYGRMMMFSFRRRADARLLPARAGRRAALRSALARGQAAGRDPPARREPAFGARREVTRKAARGEAHARLRRPVFPLGRPAGRCRGAAGGRRRRGRGGARAAPGRGWRGGRLALLPRPGREPARAALH